MIEMRSRQINTNDLLTYSTIKPVNGKIVKYTTPLLKSTIKIQTTKIKIGKKI